MSDTPGSNYPPSPDSSSPFGSSASYGQTTPPPSPYGQQQAHQYGSQYGQQNPYGTSQQYGGYQQMLPEHPQATLTLVMVILGFFVGITYFVAWYLGAQARKEIEAGAPYRWDGTLKVGYWLGKILSIVSIIGIVLSIILVIAMIVFAGSLGVASEFGSYV